MRRLPTVSEMPRATACPASVALPRHPDDGEQSAAALRGSRIHAYIAARLRKWPLPDIGKTKVSHIQLGKLRRYLGRGDVRCELAMAMDPVSGHVEVIAENVNRDYGKPSRICGAADVVMVRRDALVVDLKTGRRALAAPAENWQVACLAAMVAAAHPQVESVTGALAYLETDGSWRFESYTWGLAQLAMVRDRIRAAFAEWEDAEAAEDSGWGATATPGAHCYYCRSVCGHAEPKKREAA